jgi:hypothetical protein
MFNLYDCDHVTLHLYLLVTRVRLPKNLKVKVFSQLPMCSYLIGISL